MLKINYISTLFVDIDVSSKSNMIYAMDFDENEYVSSAFGNNQPRADELAGMIAQCMKKHKNLASIIIVLDTTSVYSAHIANFLSTSEFAKYAGLYWPKGDSEDFTCEDNKMSRAGNTYLRYYLGEAANSVRKHIREYAEYYARKYAEATRHQHKRVLALTSHKFVQLVFGLLSKNQLYTGEKLDAELNIGSN